MKSFVEFDGRKIEYNLTRKNVKNINLRIKKNGSVEVSANYYVPVSDIEAFILRNGRKISDTLSRFGELDSEKISLTSGDRVTLLGKGCKLNVVKSKRNSYSFSGGVLTLCVKEPENYECRKSVFNTLLLDISERVFPSLIREEYAKFSKYCPSVPELRIRNMKSQWGNCRAERNIITLNSRLAQFDTQVIRFVVLHEYCHFIEQNHSPAFYSELAKVMPDWKKYDSFLKKQANAF